MKAIPVLAVILTAVIVLYSSAFRVDETEQIFITEFGKPVRTINTDPNVNEAGRV